MAAVRTLHGAAQRRAFSSSSKLAKSRFSHLPLSNSAPVECPFTGPALLHSPFFNKGSAFTAEERKEFDLEGLLPNNVQTLRQQTDRAYGQFRTRDGPLAKNTFMSSMKDQNKVLYYNLLIEHTKEMFPIIYTPTQGEAIQKYSNLFRKPSGCYLTISEPEKVEENLGRWGGPDDIDLIVVSDGEAILGIGDQGVGGIAISIAKANLYTLCAGVHPERVLACVLDCGTDNHEMLNDPLYLGLHRPRIRGPEYDAFVDKFIKVAREKFPKAYLHFEDFGVNNARRILDIYRSKLPVFNDDVQGTGCVTLAALMAALDVSKVDMEDLRIMQFGSGSAGIGIADQVARAIAVKTGKSLEEARRHFWCIDKPGLLLKSHADTLSAAQVPYCRPEPEWESKEHKDLQAIIREVKPHVLIGASGRSKAFTKEAIQEMASHVDRPIVFPLSNPTHLIEADPKDINSWTDGKALIATGSPFPPVEHHGQPYEIAECNNALIYPAIGFGAILSKARLMTDDMLVAATEALAERAPALKNPDARLLPGVEHIRENSVFIAKAVIQKAVELGLNDEKDIPTADADLEEWIREQMWEPKYLPYRKVAEGTKTIATVTMA